MKRLKHLVLAFGFLINSCSTVHAKIERQVVEAVVGGVVSIGSTVYGARKLIKLVDRKLAEARANKRTIEESHRKLIVKPGDILLHHDLVESLGEVNKNIRNLETAKTIILVSAGALTTTAGYAAYKWGTKKQDQEQDNSQGDNNALGGNPGNSRSSRVSQPRTVSGSNPRRRAAAGGVTVVESSSTAVTSEDESDSGSATVFDRDRGREVASSKNQSVCTHPIVRMLMKINEFRKDSKNSFVGINAKQREFFKKYYPSGKTLNEISREEGLDKFSKDELRAWASDNFEELNQILADNGFGDMQLDGGSGGYGAVSILDVTGTWLQKADLTQIKEKDGSREYDGIALKNVSMWGPGSQEKDRVYYRVDTKSGDYVFIMRHQPLKGFQILEAIDKIEKSEWEEIKSGIKLHVPMIDYDENIDISWLQGSHIQGTRDHISEAKQITRFKMNQFGFRAQSAAAGWVSKGSRSEKHVLNEPFLLWIKRSGVDKPIFAGWFDQQYWKNPGGLDG